MKNNLFKISAEEYIEKVNDGVIDCEYLIDLLSISV